MIILKKLGYIVLALVLLAITFLAKGGDVPSLLRDLGLSGLLQKKGPDNSATVPQPVAVTEIHALAGQLEPFIICINRVDAAMRSNYDAYRRTFPAAFTGGAMYHRSFKIVPYEVDNQFSKECIKGLQDVSLAVDAELAAAGRQYASTLSELVPVMNEIDDYLAQENYRDDHWNAMRERLHPRITNMFERFLSESSRMRRAVESGELSIGEKLFVEIEKTSARDSHWHESNLMHQALLTLNTLNKIEFATENAFINVRIAEAERSFERTIDEVRRFIAQNPELKTPLGNRPMLIYIEPRAATFLTAIKTLRRNTADSNVTPSSEDFARITTAYNDLVDDYNLRVKNGQ